MSLDPTSLTDTLWCGDARLMLDSFPAGIVQTCITSPPYYGLRDYGTACWAGGDPACDHTPEQRGGRFATPVSAKQRSNTGSGTAAARDCSCGATRIDHQIGLEPTPEAYVAGLVTVFGALRRVLRDDGTLWLNIGDCAVTRAGPGRKPKDLLGIPWMLAFALRADGWWLRSDIIWHKPAPMPESIRDRPTRAHEHLFLLAKSARYYYNAQAISEPARYAGKAVRMGAKSLSRGQSTASGSHPSGNALAETVMVGSRRNRRDVWTIPTRPYRGAHFATFPPALVTPCILAGSRPGDLVLDPFVGACTVPVVARDLGRHYVGIDLSAAYLDLGRTRLDKHHAPGPDTRRVDEEQVHVG